MVVVVVERRIGWAKGEVARVSGLLENAPLPPPCAFALDLGTSGLGQLHRLKKPQSWIQENIIFLLDLSSRRAKSLSIILMSPLN